MRNWHYMGAYQSSYIALHSWLCSLECYVESCTLSSKLSLSNVYIALHILRYTIERYGSGRLLWSKTALPDADVNSDDQVSPDASELADEVDPEGRTVRGRTLLHLAVSLSDHLLVLESIR